MSLMYDWSCLCARAGHRCCSTCDGSVPPPGCHRMLLPGDTAPGKALFLGKGAISHGRRCVNRGS